MVIKRSVAYLASKKVHGRKGMGWGDVFCLDKMRDAGVLGMRM